MSSRAADVARPDGSDPAPEGTETERRLETERVDARTSEGAASSATASGRVSANMTTLTTWVGTWNVGNVAPRMDAVTQWLAHARGHDLVAVAAQEASYPHSRANLRPEAVWAETLAAQRGGDAEADVARAAARLAAADGGSTAHSSDSDDAHDAAGRSVSAKFAKKKRGFFGSSKFARASGALAGALAGGVAAGPLAPFGLVAGAAAGYYSSAKVTAELKSRRHWFDVVAAAMGPEYVPVQTATLLQMRLIVFARRDSVTDAGLIESVRVGYQATGLLNAVGNKGGLMVRLALAGGGSVAFVACHLAAHEGERRVAARDESVAAILRGCWDGSTARAVGETDVGSGAAAADTPATTASREKTPSSVPSARAEKNVAAIGPELLACTSHVFVFGDLNYRVDPGAVESSSTSGPGREKTGWGGRWKKSDDAPSGSLVAALAGLAAKSGKDRNADAAFRAARGGPRVASTDRSTDRPIDRSTQSRVRASDPGSRTIGTDGSGRSFANETGPTSRGRDADAEKNAPAEAATARWVEGWLLVAELAARGDWDALAEGDQLRREISRGRALRAFVEAPLAFAPTFKLEALEALEASAASERSARDAASADDGFSRPPRASRAYAKKRVPSWCDRVLARSLTPAHACRFVTYASCPGVRSSDHAPVYASCELAFPRASSSTASPRADVVAREETRTRTHARSESASRRLALRIRVTAFRVALEDDEEEETRFPSPRDGGCGGDDVDDDGAPRRPVDSAVARRGRETATETFFKRAASLKTSASSRGDASDAHDASPRAASAASLGVFDAAAGARGAMEKLTRGADAAARFSLSGFADDAFRGAFDANTDVNGDPSEDAAPRCVAAGVTRRLAQPLVERDESGAIGVHGGVSGSSPRGGARASNVSNVTAPAVVAHWAAAALPGFQSKDFHADAAALEASVRALSAGALVAAVAIDKEHAGIATVPLGDVCGAFLRDPSSGSAAARPFDVPFDRFARRRGRAEGTLTIETTTA